MQPMALSWMKDAVVYQIYPQSFQDSNGDGIGDFQGIIRRLDYIQSLGVNVIWMNPCFDSPFGDAGYDVRDFYKVAPRYGTEQDLVELFEAAHRRGMRVVLDLVAGHTSMDNAWFLEEVANPKSPEANRYIWKNRDFDPKKGPAPEDFVANFFWYQPALNYGYENPTEPWQDAMDAPGPRKNRAELRGILSYWFDRGCDGFRVDMAGSLIKGAGQDNQAITRLWQDVRGWMDEEYPGRALVAEWSRPDVSVAAGFHLDFMMHFNAPGYPSLFFNGAGTIPPKEGPCYFDPAGEGSLEIFRREYAKQLAATRGAGYVSLPTANHDFQRLRCGARGWEGLRPAWVFLMTQAGVPTIYYGDEIGMRFVTGTPAKEGSTLTCLNLETAPNAGAADGERSGTRTPMHWDSSPNDGFSTAEADQLYLPMDECEERPTVESQEKDPDSLLNFVRHLTRLRVEHPALGADGEFSLLNPDDQHYPMVYVRSLDGKHYLVAINPSAEPQTMTLASELVPGEVVLAEGCCLASAENGFEVSLAPFGYGICKC
jgi:maltose alpha-D-glucosyltransferase/alpha-amylase